MLEHFVQTSGILIDQCHLAIGKQHHLAGEVLFFVRMLTGHDVIKEEIRKYADLELHALCTVVFQAQRRNFHDAAVDVLLSHTRKEFLEFPRFRCRMFRPFDFHITDLVLY